MTVANDHRNPLTRPESAVLNLLEEILTFDAATNYRTGDVVARVFARQPAAIKTAIRKHWIFDHLPFYSAFIDLELSEFEQDLANRFWIEVEQEAQKYKPQQRRQEVVTA